MYNIYLQSAPRVKFAPQPTVVSQYQNPFVTQQQVQAGVNPLQRSKSLSSADAIARGMAGLGLTAGNDSTDIGTFIPEIQALIDQSQQDPNQLNARSLMELANHIMQRAVEGRRFVELFYL